MEDSLHLYPNCAHNRGLTWKARPYGNTTPIVDFIIFQKGDLEGLNALLLMLLFKVIKGRCCSERALLCVLFLVCSCDMSRGGQARRRRQQHQSACQQSADGPGRPGAALSPDGTSPLTHIYQHQRWERFAVAQRDD